MYAEESFLAPKWTHRCKAALSLSGLQARGAGVEARDGFRDGISIVGASIRPILGPEASSEWELPTKRVIFLSDCFSMGYPNEAWGIRQLSEISLG